VVNYDELNSGMSRPLKGRVQLGDEVASFIRDLIMSGQLTSGEYIRLDRLSTHLGVSATPIREALMSLRAEGFVELEPRKGFVVSRLTAKDIADVFFVQATLAGELAARAVNVIDEESLGKLREIQSRIKDAVETEDLEALELQNYLFHREINLLAASPKLAWLLGTVVRYSPRRLYSGFEGWPQAVVEDHSDVLAAFERGDATRARETMASHIIHVGDLLAEFLNGVDARSSREGDADSLTSIFADTAD
jgi:DNA-binding GntR family transcriptional regulator